MRRFEYDIEGFDIVEKWSAKNQSQKLQELVDGLDAKGTEGWELLGLHSFNVVGGITGSKKGAVTMTLWKRELQ